MPQTGLFQAFQGQPATRKTPLNRGKSDSQRRLGVGLLGALFLVSACSPIDAPDPRTPNIPIPITAEERRKALNENGDAVMIVPLENDVLVPKFSQDDPLPMDQIGPLDFRGETLANALELVVADYNIPLAFETNEGLKRRITVSNLSGSVDKVVERICGLANLYCAYDDGILVVRDTQTFTVALPPIDEGVGDAASGGSSGNVADNVASALAAITKTQVTSDPSTHTLVYTATQRSARAAQAYFERLRASTALIIYETYIWEVQLTNANSTGIQWQQLEQVGAYNIGLNTSGAISNAITGTPISIGLPTRGEVDFDAGDVLRFISEQGAVKTISQPQITVLSGSRASMKVTETRNYISELTRTTSDTGGQESVSTETDQVDSGFTLEIQSNWDQGTVYGSIQIDLQQFLGFQDFQAGTNGTLSLPRTSQRQLNTSVRVRPGDSILIAGLVSEQDNYDRAGPGFNQPILPVSRSTGTQNSELVFLLHPRVVVYKPIGEIEAKKAAKEQLPEDLSNFVYDPATAPQTDLPMGTVQSDALDPSTGPRVQKETVPMPKKPKDLTPAPTAPDKVDKDKGK